MRFLILRLSTLSATLAETLNNVFKKKSRPTDIVGELQVALHTLAGEQAFLQEELAR